MIGQNLFGRKLLSAAILGSGLLGGRDRRMIGFNPIGRFPLKSSIVADVGSAAISHTRATTATVPSSDTTDGTGQKIVFANETRLFSLVGLNSMALIGPSNGLVEMGYYL